MDPWEGFTGEDHDPQFLQGQYRGLPADRDEEGSECASSRQHWVQTLPGVTVPGTERGQGQWMPQGLFKEEGTQLRPGPVTPKTPLRLGAVRGEPLLIYGPPG